MSQATITIEQLGTQAGMAAMILIASIGVACAVTAARGPGAVIGDAIDRVFAGLQEWGAFAYLWITEGHDDANGIRELVMSALRAWCTVWAEAREGLACLCCTATWAAIGIASVSWLVGPLAWWAAGLAVCATLAVSTRLYGCVERRRSPRESEARERVAAARCTARAGQQGCTSGCQ